MKPITGIEHIVCNLCGGEETSLLFKLPVQQQHKGLFNRDEWDIVQCQRCGLIYGNPRPDTDALEYYYTFDNKADCDYVKNWFIGNADFNRKTWKQILRTVSRYCSQGSILDIGCGAGTFLSEALQFGYQVTGQEVAPYFIKYCREELGLTVYAGYLEDIRLPDASFDIVTAFDVIEHHPDPHALLSEMRRLIRPGGLVVVGTHDIGNLFARWYGTKWRHMVAIGHLTFFTRKTLAKMMAATGFKVIQSSGAHTIDNSLLAEIRNAIIQFLRVFVLRAMILGIYKPITHLVPALTHWKIKTDSLFLDHPKLLMRVGNQVIINDNMVLLARPD